MTRLQELGKQFAAQCDLNERVVTAGTRHFLGRLGEIDQRAVAAAPQGAAVVRRILAEKDAVRKQLVDFQEDAKQKHSSAVTPIMVAMEKEITDGICESCGGPRLKIRRSIQRTEARQVLESGES